MTRPVFACLFAIFLVAPAAAQTQQEGEMRLYIQQLEGQVRQLTGENEQLNYQVNQLRAQLGLPATTIGPEQTGAVPTAPAPGADLSQVLPGAGLAPGADASQGLPQAEFGAPSAEAAPPLDAGGVPAQRGAGAPVDLSTLAGGAPAQPLAPENAPLMQNGQAPAVPPSQTAVLAPRPAPTTALTGSARDEYDLAYGYILTGDYGLAEENFKAWLASFPNDPQAPDAEFWLGESHLQQREYRDAANAFLAVYKQAPDSNKGPDALLKLGVSLAALGEKPAACATFAELGRRYPKAPESVMSRVRDEKTRAGCAG